MPAVCCSAVALPGHRGSVVYHHSLYKHGSSRPPPHPSCLGCIHCSCTVTVSVCIYTQVRKSVRKSHAAAPALSLRRRWCEYKSWFCLVVIVVVAAAAAPCPPRHSTRPMHALPEPSRGLLADAENFFEGVLTTRPRGRLRHGRRVVGRRRRGSHRGSHWCGGRHWRRGSHGRGRGRRHWRCRCRRLWCLCVDLGWEMSVHLLVCPPPVTRACGGCRSQAHGPKRQILDSCLNTYRGRCCRCRRGGGRDRRGGLDCMYKKVKCD